MKAAYDKGLNTWDTANVYSNGVSEAIVGKALKKYQIPRHKVVILTKCYNAVAEDPEGRYFLNRSDYQASKDYQNNFGLGRAAIYNQVEASLERLGTDYIDLLQIHRFDKDVPIEETSIPHPHSPYALMPGDLTNARNSEGFARPCSVRQGQVHRSI